MKKTIAAVLAAVSISLAAGCAANLAAGYDKFTAAREKYETLSSGRVTMTDLTTGDEIMRFSFFFTANDEMVFSYWGSWQGEEQQAYSDGAEFFYKESGDEKWTVIGSDDDGYIYNVYNRLSLPLRGGAAFLPCRGSGQGFRGHHKCGRSHSDKLRLRP